MKELWIKAVDGDKQAEKEIYRHLLERFTVLAGLVLCKEDAEDIAQEACSVVLKEYKTLRSPFEYTAWAQKIYKNKMASYFQRKSVEKKIFSGKQVESHGYTAAVSDEDHAIMMTMITCLQKLIEAFPRYARAVNLVQLGYDTDEICRRMDISRNNLYVLLNRGRKILKECIFEGDSQ